MKFDEKTEKKHKAAIRKLMIFGLGPTKKHEIQYELSKKFRIDFDLNYIHRLLLEIHEDTERELAHLRTPEGQEEFMKQHVEQMAKLDKLEAEIRSQKD